MSIELADPGTWRSVHAVVLWPRVPEVRWQAIEIDMDRAPAWRARPEAFGDDWAHRAGRLLARFTPEPLVIIRAARVEETGDGARVHLEFSARVRPQDAGIRAWDAGGVAVDCRVGPEALATAGEDGLTDLTLDCRRAPVGVELDGSLRALDGTALEVAYGGPARLSLADPAAIREALAGSLGLE